MVFFSPVIANHLSLILFWKLLVQLGGVRLRLSAARLYFLTPFYTTDVFGSPCDHNDNHHHADAPLSCRFRLWAL